MQFYMHARPGTIARPREVLLASAAGLLLSLIMTWPLATGLSRLGRTSPNNADGQFSIWNVSWVARTIVADPLHLFDANIFAPHKTTLAYSEANLLPGALGVVPWWLTRNPWLTLNVVMLIAFASAFVGAYLLLLSVSGSRPAAAAGGVIYAFCPYVMSHLSHIQLLYTGGIPLSLYFLHRLADSFRLKAETTPSPEFRLKADATPSPEFRLKAEATPSPEFRLQADATPRNRAVALGLTLAAQALCCAYYGIFAGLIVGYATLVLAATRGLWRSRSYWTAIATAAAIALLLTMPFFIPYLRLQDQTGFARSLEETIRWSARPVDYLTSSAHAHAALLAYSRTLDRYQEVLFPGFLVVTLGAAGIVVALRRASPDREAALLYGSLGVLAFWSSFGPRAGLYSVLAKLPAFSFLHAPSRFGLVVVLVLAVFACIAMRALIERVPSRLRPWLGGVAIAAAIADVAVFPIGWDPAPAIPPGYAVLSHHARATLADFPFYGERIAFPLHAQYMLFSTTHWLPIVNGYSDLIPADFRRDAPILDSFPSTEAFAALSRHRVRYIAVHWDMYVDRKDEIRQRLERYRRNLNVLASDDRMTIYEVIAYP